MQQFITQNTRQSGNGLDEWGNFPYRRHGRVAVGMLAPPVFHSFLQK